MKLRTYNLKREPQQNRKGILGSLFPSASSFKLHASSRGFTLVETLVAISVLMVAVASPLTIAQKSLSSATYAKDQTIAFFLAQDAVEYLKYIRLGESSAWPEKVLDCTIADPAGKPDEQLPWCRLDSTLEYNDDASTALCSSGSCRLSFNENTKIYAYESGPNIEASRFSRRFYVSPAVNDSEGNPIAYTVTVDVSWRSGSFAERSIRVRDILYNWR
jgi:prepilin-type N-terminal cleavage/methylation domain-containing protein